MLAHESLLKAALLRKPEALAAWEEWKSSIDLDHIDAGSYRLLPLLHRNLETHGVKHPDMGRLRGVWRRTWYQNQLTLREAVEGLRAFGAAGIETMVLRGTALIAAYYKDAGLRPMRDCDVLVPENKAEDAIRILQDRGWIRITPAPERLTERFRRFRNSIAFRNDSGVELDLHWHVLSFCCSSETDDELWRGAKPIRIQGVDTLALNPTDQLLHTCLSGLEWSYLPSIWWVADAMAILEASAPIDQERFFRFASERRLGLLARRALEYLAATLDAPIPQDALRSLSAEPIRSGDQLEYESVTRPYRQRSALAWIVGAYQQHKRSGRGNFLGYLEGALRWGAVPYAVERVRGNNRRPRKQLQEDA